MEAALSIAHLYLSAYPPQSSIQEITTRLERLTEQVPKDERGGPLMREIAKALKLLTAVGMS